MSSRPIHAPDQAPKQTGSQHSHPPAAAHPIQAPTPRSSFSLSATAVLDPSEQPLLRKSETGQESNPQERQADAMANSVVHGAPPPPIAHPYPLSSHAPSSLAPDSGHPLPGPARQMMEQSLGFDFSHVRIHADEHAHSLSEALSATAFTHGSDIFFRNGFPDTAATEGKHLLAHELTHIIQQSTTEGQVQRQPGPSPQKGVHLDFSVIVTSEMGPEKLMLEFIKQYRRLSSDEEAIAVRNAEGWHWLNVPEAVSAADAKKGYKILRVHDLTLQAASAAEQSEQNAYFQGLPQVNQDVITEEAYKRFWEKTQYKVGQKLGASPDDQRMLKTFLIIRDELIRQQKEIDALPPAIAAFLFTPSDSPTLLGPEDFDKVLRIAAELEKLTPTQLAEYQSRTVRKTKDWGEFEAAIRQYVKELTERSSLAQERMVVETKLANLETLYEHYRAWAKMVLTGATISSIESAGAMSGSGNYNTSGAAIGTLMAAEEMRKGLEAECIAAGFPGGIAEFEQFIKRYEQTFERETLALSTIMLDQYEHVLWQQELRYQNAAEATDLPKAAATEHALKQKEARTCFVPSPEASELVKKHPLVQNTDFDRDALSKAQDAEEAKRLVLEYIAARRRDIAETRKNIAAKPSMIYGLDALLEASIERLNIQSNSIYDRIVRQHISDVHWIEAIPQIILAVIAVAAGILSGGTGTIAVLAGAAVLGIGAYQAVEEFKRYEQQQAAYGAQLASDDPSMAWVIIAVIGAGLDAALFVKALQVAKFRSALDAFNAGSEAGDVAKLEQKLAQLAEVEESIRKSVLKAAEAEAQARAAWRAVLRPPAVLRAVIVPGAEEFGRLVYAVYTTLKKGVRDFIVFSKTNEAIALIGDITKLPAEELAALKTGYLQAVSEADMVAAKAKVLGVVDKDADAFMRLLANSKNMSTAEIAQRMADWSAATAAGGFKWGNPLSKPTYGHTFIDHTKKLKPLQLIDRARGKGHQIGQWLDDTAAAEIIAEVAKRGPGEYNIPIPSSLGRSFLADGTELASDMARVIVKPDGSVRTAFPYNSAYLN